MDTSFVTKLGLAGRHLNKRGMGVQFDEKSQETGKDSMFSSFVAGTAGGLVSSLVTHPLDVVITRMQAQHHSSSRIVKYRSTGAALLNIVTTEGYNTLFSGVVPGLFGSMAIWGVYFVAYNHLRAILQARFQNENAPRKEQLSPLSNVSCAVAAGCISTVATQPIWLIKTRLQLQMHPNPRYHGTMHCFVEIVRREGSMALFRSKKLVK